mmetsp:Transcript_35664/g.142471  ORF Transcript_35664/g.142471 Transcript_35664/m.142471 type:complete len:243 (+) Transcript_35664:1972-2700(+)
MRVPSGHDDHDCHGKSDEPAYNGADNGVLDDIHEMHDHGKRGELRIHTSYYDNCSVFWRVRWSVGYRRCYTACKFHRQCFLANRHHWSALRYLHWHSSPVVCDHEQRCGRSHVPDCCRAGDGNYRAARSEPLRCTVHNDASRERVLVNANWISDKSHGPRSWRIYIPRLGQVRCPSANPAVRNERAPLQPNMAFKLDEDRSDDRLERSARELLTSAIPWVCGSRGQLLESRKPGARAKPGVI